MAQTSSNLITRGALYNIIRNAIPTETVSITYENTQFLQHLTGRVHGLPSRWSDGELKEQHMVLDTDLLLKQDMIDVMEEDKTSDDRIAIIQKITDGMDK